MYTITTKLVSKVFLTWFKGLYALLHKYLRKSGQNYIHYFHGYCVHCVYCCIDSSQKMARTKKTVRRTDKDGKLPPPVPGRPPDMRWGMAAETFA